MERIHREVGVIYGGEGVGEAGVVEMGLGAEGESLHVHFEVAIESAFESADGEIFDGEDIFCEFVIAPGFEVGGVEPLIGHLDIMTIKMAAAGPIAGRIAALAGKIGDEVRSERLTKDGADILQGEAAAIMQIPIGFGEAGKLGAQIQFGMRTFPGEVIELEGVAMQSELGGDVKAEWEIALQSQLDLIPGDTTDVGIVAVRGNRVSQQEREVLAFQIERDALVIDGGAAVAQFEAADAQIEERFLPRILAGGGLGVGMLLAPFFRRRT